MGTFISGLKSNWHFMRIVRLFFALTMLASFISTGEKVALFGAVFFGYQAIFDAGCCGAQGCYSPTSKSNNKIDEVEFEEIKAE